MKVRLHDQVGRLAVGQPHAAHRGDGRADHHGEHDDPARQGPQHENDHEGPDRQPDHRDAVENPRDKGHHGGHRHHGRQNGPVEPPQQEQRDAFQHPRLRDDRDEERQAEDEEHRVGVNQLIEAAIRQEVRARPHPPTRFGNLGVPLRRSEPAEGRHDHQQHSVGQGVLVQLVFEGTEQEQREDGREHFDRQQPHRKRRDPSGCQDHGGNERAAEHEPAAGQHDDRWLNRGDVGGGMSEASACVRRHGDQRMQRRRVWRIPSALRQLLRMRCHGRSTTRPARASVLLRLG